MMKQYLNFYQIETIPKKNILKIRTVIPMFYFSYVTFFTE